MWALLIFIFDSIRTTLASPCGGMGQAKSIFNHHNSKSTLFESRSFQLALVCMCVCMYHSHPKRHSDNGDLLVLLPPSRNLGQQDLGVWMNNDKAGLMCDGRKRHRINNLMQPEQSMITGIIWPCGLNYYLHAV